ncbi:MAG TPA: aromatic amino acid DMT transporter YddG [Candidatus Aphodousia faecigallinarum]|uniref:Aromatic amino acid DMT transporter YddG n=1 Tax=Candidatus Aphodousia faecigallinarum TaxID=2840677 RepID=A0A9D1LFP1_9BURK|nr:aromatic amino acid DMT transporter YddG [Candidatus Aphodousia faecigallinarum]
MTGATLIGLVAPLMWGASVSLIRTIAENFGIAQGQCLLYIVAAIALFFIIGLPKFDRIPWQYKTIGLVTANLSSITFCLSLNYSNGGTQTMEVGMVNYLWPTLTIVFAILFNGQKARWWIAPGAILSFCGIYWILANGQIAIDAFIDHIKINPISYFLALMAAITWAAFSSMTRAWSKGENMSTIIFIFNTLIFGAFWFMGVGGAPEVNSFGILSVILGGLAIGVAYASWTHGMSYGNITVLAIASYFTPVLSCLFASVWIGAELTGSFWQGVAMVVTGSVICWHATRSASKK